jgi:hypothetical protein
MQVDSPWLTVARLICDLSLIVCSVYLCIVVMNCDFSVHLQDTALYGPTRKTFAMLRLSSRVAPFYLLLNLCRFFLCQFIIVNRNFRFINFASVYRSVDLC